jgi:hypothetical protein
MIQISTYYHVYLARNKVGQRLCKLLVHGVIVLRSEVVQSLIVRISKNA